MPAVFEPTITLGTIVSILVNVTVLGLPAIWWASKITQALKETKIDVAEIKDTMMTKDRVMDLKADAEREHRDIREATKAGDDALRREINGLRGTKR